MPNREYITYQPNTLPFFPSDGPKRQDRAQEKEFYHPEKTPKLPLQPIYQKRRIENPPQQIPPERHQRRQ